MTAGGTAGRVTRRRLRTRANPLEAAFSAFASQGFGHVSTEEVCEAAGRTRGAFCLHFVNLDELSFALRAERAELIAGQVAEALARDGPDLGLPAAVDRVTEILLLDRDRLLVRTDFLVHAARDPEAAHALLEHRARSRRAVAGRIARARGRTGLPAVLGDVEGAAHAVIAAYDGVTTRLLPDRDVAGARARPKQLLTALLTGEQEGTVAMDADVIVVGAGLAGLVAAHELTSRGRRVALVDQENAANLGGQAFWSFGGLFLVGSPEQRRLGIKDTFDLAWNDWRGSAGFDRLDDEDSWAVRWARAYVEWAAGEKRSWLDGHGITFLPTVGWAERGGLRADGHGNTVPRFHIAWGTGTGVVAPFVRYARQAAGDGLLTFHHRHRVDELVLEDGTARGVRGTVLAEDGAPRGVASSRETIGEFELTARAVIVTSGGIGADHDMVRRHWPERLGTPPREMVTGVPAYVDGRMLGISARAGVRLVNRDRMWHYTEGLQNWDPVWPGHGIRILPGPSSMWFDALGRRLPGPCLPGYDTLGTLKHLRTTEDLAGHDHSWFVLTRKIIEKEFALSGSEQNPDITAKDRAGFLRTRLLGKGAPGPVDAFLRRGADFVTAPTVEQLVERMNALTDEPLLDAAVVRRQIEARDLQMDNAYSKDVQVQGIRNARRYIGDRLGRVAAPHRILDPAAGPLIGVKLHVLTRKTLGGIQTDLDSRALGADGRPVEGLYAAGEVAGFGGGGLHGYNALEGTFLGGCLFSGRAAGRAAADRAA